MKFPIKNLSLNFNFKDFEFLTKKEILLHSFLTLFFCAQIFHEFKVFRYSYDSLITGILFVISFFAIKTIKKDSAHFFSFRLYSFFILVVYKLFRYFTLLPALSNHENLLFFIYLFLTAAFFIQFYKHKNINLTLTEIQYPLLLGLSTVYFMAFVHKLNYDFLNPDISCANWYHSKMLSRLGFSFTILPNLIKQLSPYLVLLAELLAPILLFIPSTKMLGLLFAIGMHYYLILGGFTDFAAICFSILIFALPIFQSPYDFVTTDLKKRLSVYSIGTLLVLIYSLGLALITLDPHPSTQVPQGMVFIFITFYFLMPYKFKLLTNAPSISSLFKFQNFTLAILLFLFSILPYLGYRSGGNFTMFSNLKVEGQNSNHFFLKDFNLFKNQNELLQIKSLSNNHLFHHRFDYGDWITKTGLFIGIQRWHKLYPNEDVEIRIKQKGEYSKNISSLDYYNSEKDKYPYHIKKFYYFRFLADKQNPNQCRW